MFSKEAKQLKLWGDAPSKYIFILFAGKAGAGKSTFAQMVRDELKSRSYTVTLSSFASPIKDCAKLFFDWDGKKDERGRRLLQRIGTEVGREYDPDLWVRKLVHSASRGIFHPDFVLVDDWRFPNEKEFISKIEEYEVYTIKINNPRIENYAGMHHTSELSLTESDDYYDYVIFNGGTLEQLRVLAKELVDYLFNKEM